MLLNGWFVHSVQRKRRTSGAGGVGSKGDTQYATATTIQCRAEIKVDKVQTANGTEFKVGYVLAMTEAPRLDDLYWMPAIGAYPADDTTADDAGRAPTSFKVATNKVGAQHLFEVYFS